MPLSTLKNKVIASSLLILHPLTWQSQADFVADLQDYGDGQQVRKTLRPTSLLFSSFAWNMWEKKYSRDALPDVTHQKRKIEWKILPLPMPPTRNSFHELCDSSPIQGKKRTANYSNQVPICAHSINLLPACCVFFVARRPLSDRS